MIKITSFLFLTFSLFVMIGKTQNATVGITTNCVDKTTLMEINTKIKGLSGVSASVFCNEHNVFLVRVSKIEIEVKELFLNKIQSFFSAFTFEFKDLSDSNFLNLCKLTSDADIKEKLKFNE